MGYNMSTVLNVLVIGHSHAYWLGKFVDASGLFANFKKLGYNCKITFLGLSDSEVRHLVRFVGLMSWLVSDINRLISCWFC